MQRRRFLTSSLAASAFALASKSRGQGPAGKPREYYQLQKYQLQAGPQTKLTSHYFSDALIPALNRLGITPVGAFELTYGPETPTLYLLIPSASLETLVTAELRLAQDEEFLKAAAPFWNAPGNEPAFVRITSSLLIAFEGWPKITPPAREKRIFQLRTYQSPSHRDHIRKIESFHSGEFDFFRKAGCGQVFYGDALIGPHLPCLTYMLTFPDMAALEKGWAAFRSDPDWIKLSTSPRFSFEPTVSNVSNLLLSPLPFSQI